MVHVMKIISPRTKTQPATASWTGESHVARVFLVLLTTVRGLVAVRALSKRSTAAFISPTCVRARDGIQTIQAMTRHRDRVPEQSSCNLSDFL